MPESFWAQGHIRGTCIKCGEPARHARAFYCAEHTPVSKKAKPKVKAGSPPAAGPSDVGPATDSDGPGGAYGDTERRPSEPKEPLTTSGLLGKLTGRTTGGGASAKAPPGSSSERRPSSPPKRRVSTTEFWGSLVEGGASIAGRAGYVPMARSMVWSSPVAGEIIEDATKGTVADRLIQPLCRNGERWQDLFDLLGFWAAIGVAQSNPAQAPAALGFARKRLVNLLPRIADNIRKQRAKERAAVEALTELMPDLAELFPDAGDADPVDLLLQSLFAAPAEPEPVHAP